MTDKLLDIIGQTRTLTAFPPCQEDGLKAAGMTFSINAYRADGLGHISTMKAKGFCGLMQMETLIINPTERDLPLYSYDRIFAMGKDTLITELYDTILDPCDLSALRTVSTRFSDLRDRDPGTHWYDALKLPESISKKGRKAQKNRLDELSEDYLRTYLSLPAHQVANKEAKRRKTSQYVDGLLKNGGPSTDAFIHTLGEERTAHLFRKVLFGTDNESLHKRDFSF